VIGGRSASKEICCMRGKLMKKRSTACAHFAIKKRPGENCKG